MKKTILSITAATVVLAWLSLIPGYYLVEGKTQWLFWVTAVAVISEAGFWVAAATMGVAVYEARRRIWTRLVGSRSRSTS